MSVEETEKLYDLVITLIDSGEINSSRVLKAANNITLDIEDESQTILVELIAMLKKSEQDPEGKALKAAREALTELLDD
jgi:sugar diacid utilization regulator